MTTTAMVDTYVRQLLLGEHGDELEICDGGGYLVPLGPGVRVWVVSGNHRSRRVLVTARLLEGVEADLDLFDALNDLNAVTPYGRYFHADGEVVVEDTVLAEDLEPSTLFASVSFVAWAAETQATKLAERIGHVEEYANVGPTGGANAVDLEERAASVTDGADPRPVITTSQRPTVSAGGYL